MMRLATWNIEYFADLFDAHDTLLADDEPSHRHGVTRALQADAIAWVLERVDADLFMIIEAPNSGHTQDTVRALEGFAAAYGLRQRKAVMGFVNATEQEIAALYDPDRLSVAHTPMDSLAAPRFDGTFRLKVDVDGHPDEHVFSKPPLELTLTAEGIDPPLRLIGVHAKSKAPHGAVGTSQVAELAEVNRRKQLAECVWLRRRIDEMRDAGLPVIVMGDLNDGPGLDHYEKLFGKSSVEVVLGSPDDPARLLHDPHAGIWLNPRQGWTLATARFYHQELKCHVNALLDYVMVSQDILTACHPRWHIWHPFDDPKIYADPSLRDALLAASDHFPVSIDLG